MYKTKSTNKSSIDLSYLFPKNHFLVLFIKGSSTIDVEMVRATGRADALPPPTSSVRYIQPG